MKLLFATFVPLTLEQVVAQITVLDGALAALRLAWFESRGGGSARAVGCIWIAIHQVLDLRIKYMALRDALQEEGV